MVFDWFKRKTPPAPLVLRPEMIKPVGEPLSTAQAKSTYRAWMLMIGHLSEKTREDKTVLAYAVESFAEDMKLHLDELKTNLSDARADRKDEVKELKAHLLELKKELAQCADPTEQKALARAINVTEKDIQTAPQGGEQEAAEIEQFKADKRAFLVDYINTEVHGPDWRTKA